MKFVLVNDRTTGKQPSCVLCGGSIGRGYLREIGTGLFYCDHDCYADHCKNAGQALANLAIASLGFFAPSQMTARSEAERAWRSKRPIIVLKNSPSGSVCIFRTAHCPAICQRR